MTHFIGSATDHPGPRRGWHLWLALVMGWCSTASGGQVPSAAVESGPRYERSAFRDRVVFEIPQALTSRLSGLELLVENQQWPEAIEALQGVLKDFPEAVVESEPHRFLGLREWCHGELAGWPVVGRETYRATVDVIAGARFREALARRDRGSMARLAEESWGSSIHDDALWFLAHWAFEDGDLELAERAWRRLLPPEILLSAPGAAGNEGLPRLWQTPTSDYAPDQVLARIVVCHLYQADRVRAARSVEAYAHLFPGAQGRLGGNTGRLADILVDLWQAAEAERLSAAPSLTDVTCEVLSPESRPLLHERSHMVWSRLLPRIDVALVAGTSLELASPGRPVHSVFVVGEAVVIASPQRVQVVSLVDGNPLWPVSDPADDGRVFPVGVDVALRPPILPGLGQVRGQAAVDQESFFGVMGWPMTATASSELRDLESRLISLDLGAGEGRTLWIAEDRGHLPVRWRFSGSPLPLGDRVFVPTASQQGPQILGLACFHARDGGLAWHRELCTLLDSRPVRMHHFGTQTLVRTGEHILWSTPGACVLCLEAATGRIIWGITYTTHRADDGRISERLPTEVGPPSITQGTAYVPAVDGGGLIAIDMDQGVLQWMTRLPSPIREVPGVSHGVVVVSGTDLWGLDARTGAILWRFGFEDPAAQGYGRAALLGPLVWWSTHDTLFAVEISRGEVVARIDLREAWGLSGGDVIVAGDRLLLVSPERISALSGPWLP